MFAFFIEKLNIHFGWFKDDEDIPVVYIDNN